MKKLCKYACTLAAQAVSASALFLSCFSYILGNVSVKPAFCAYSAYHTERDFCDDFTQLSAFTTYFDADNAERCHNIALAAKTLDKTVICAGECFSFNAAVGARTAENGYKKAKVIEDGRFVLGIGGGVCQVSTTVYNAAVLAGLEICELHAHSLQVGYVPPSRDAMVSGTTCDLRFKNARQTPVLMRVLCGDGCICCAFYGKSDGLSYSFLSKEIEIVPRPAAVLVEGDDERVISFGRDGLISEGYVFVSDGVTSEILRVRRDRYLAVPDVVQKKRAEMVS